MNPLRILAGIFLSVLCCARPVAAGEQSIDLNKPVGESLKVDGFHWAFDDGLVGTGDPRTVEDLSGNGLTGYIAGSKEVPPPTYAEGKFGTAIFLQGQGSIVRWAENSQAGSPMNIMTSDAKGTAFTTGIWFKMEDLKPVAHILIRRDGGARKGWRIAVVKADSKESDSPGTSWKLRMEFGDYKGDPGTRATTESFADGGWHHIGVSVAPDGSSANSVEELANFTAIYWLDGEVLDTVTFSTKEVDVEQGTHSIVVGDSAQGIVDDAFIASGVHTFKK